jgi:putative endonuclease
MSNLRRVGADGEDRAAEYLIAKGYTIITRRYTVRGGEIDLIALDGETLVFIEVKERRASGLVPEEAVGAEKVQRMIRAAERFRADYENQRGIRFDLIAIDPNGIRHYEGCYGTP